MALEFRGKAGEYFRIWIVNLCLTLLTLGIFSAWAKVRKKRYFYSHTLLDGTPFQYLAQPLPIFKGRIVATLLFLIYYASSHLFTRLLPFVIIVALALAPWVVVRSAAFNARYSAYRNMCFSFDGDYRGALMALYWLGLVPVLAAGIAYDLSTKAAQNKAAYGTAFAVFGAVLAIFGILFPWWQARLRTFLVDHMRYGGINGKLDISGGELWGIYFRGGLLIGAGVAIAGLSVALTAAQKAPAPVIMVFALLSFYIGYIFGYAYIQAASGNLVWNNTRLGPLRFESTLRGRDLAWLYLSNAIGIIASCALLTPWAVVRTLGYRASHMRVCLDGDLAEFFGSNAASVQAAGAEVSQIFDIDLSL